jgi:hypothetical protein
MNDFRSQRLKSSVYRPRRHSWVSAYNEYVAHPSPDAPTFDLLPDVANLASFLPFREMIKAPEDIRINDESFSLSAFAQLPVQVAEWKSNLDAELAELVKIPLLSSKNATSRWALAQSSMIHVPRCSQFLRLILIPRAFAKTTRNALGLSRTNSASNSWMKLPTSSTPVG